MVLSMGPATLKATPVVEPGAELSISTMTAPALRGVKTAISGGPVLVRGAKRQRFKTADSDSYEFGSMMERHPRSAIGWNENYFFLVTVDGRQKGVSAGMTLNELAAYLVELGCEEAWVGTEPDNVPARRLYESRGAEAEAFVMYVYKL